MITEIEYITKDGSTKRQKCEYHTPEEMFADADLYGWKIKLFFSGGEWLPVRH